MKNRIRSRVLRPFTTIFCLIMAVGTLAQAGTISGQVTNSDGEPLQDIYVNAYEIISGVLYGRYTDADGDYSISGLPAGTYRVRFLDFDGPYISQVYDGVPGEDIWNSGDEISVTEGETVTGIDAVLEQGATISGRVTNTDGDPLEGISVQARETMTGSWYSGWTDADGQYAISGLPTGIYRVMFRDYNGPFISQVYDGVPGEDIWNSGDEISVTEGETVTGIDAVLEQGATISGRVTNTDGEPLHDIYVRAYEIISGVWYGGRFTERMAIIRSLGFLQAPTGFGSWTLMGRICLRCMMVFREQIFGTAVMRSV